MPNRRRVALLVESNLEYGRGILRGIGSYMHEHRHWDVFHHVDSLPKTLPANLRSWRPEGIIGQFETKEILAQVKRLKVPVVELYSLHSSKGISYLDVDHGEVTRLAIEHYESLGYQQFAYCGFKGIHYCERRCKAFSEQLKAKGVAVNIFQSVPPARARGTFEIETRGMFDIDRIGRWLEGLPKPLAVLAGTDTRARHVLEACRLYNFEVPGEISVTGVGNDEILCNLADPTLTSIALRPEAIGRDAAALLDEMINGRPALEKPKFYGPLCIVPRESTNSLAIADPVISDAINFIRSQILRGAPVGVVDIARHAGLSRSTLQRRFIDLLDCSPRDEIIRLQIERVRELLRGTTSSLNVISNRVGFSSPGCMFRLFKRKTGETPTEYRRRTERL